MAGNALHRDLVLAPITALAFYTSASGRRYLLAGEDTHIRVYEASSSTTTTTNAGRLCCQFRAFSVQSIHGICVRPDDGTVLIWGNQNIAVLPGGFVEDRLANEAAASPSRIHETRAPDWIFDGILAPGTDGRCFLVTAHNEVLEVTWEGGQAQQQQQRDPYVLRFGRVVYPARPALYSARIAWASGSEVLVAGGTVFGEIVVWKCAVFADADEDAKPRLLFLFSGHEGSIFGVDFSPELARPDGSRGRLLASCSDDRTVRVWDVSEAASGAGEVVHGFDEARETGFVGIDAALSAVQDRTGASVAVAMGHVSRIWNVRFGAVPDAQGDPTRLAMPVYTFGEDATVCKWALGIEHAAWAQRTRTSTAGEVAVLTHQETFANHDGKHIWASDIAQQTEDGVATTMIATGGADGRVNIIHDAVHSGGSRETVEPQRHFETVVVKDLLERVSPSIPLSVKRKKTTLHQFVYLAHDRILGVSNSGQVVLGTTTGTESTWEDVPLGDIDPSTLAVCSVMRTPAPGIGLLGTPQNKLLLYRDGAIREMATLSGKIADMYVVDGIGPDDSRHYGDDNGGLRTVSVLVVLIGARDAMQLLTLDLDAAVVTSTLVVPDQEPGYIATSARMLTRDVLAVGSRHGHLTLFRRDDAGLATISPVDRRTEDTITSIVPLPDQPHSPLDDRFLFLTTSRDGYYRLYETEATDTEKETRASLSLRLLHETTSTGTVTLEDAWFTASGPRELILAGFRGKRFVLYNAARRLELAAVDCSGSHRSFTYRALSARDPAALRFAFNRASDLGLYVQRAAGYITPKHGTHGREMRTAAVGGRWIATGAEDTVVRLWEYDEAGAEARCVAAVKLHRAGLQAIRWAPPARDHGEQQQEMTREGRRLFSCAGNEEFIVWRVRDAGSSAFPGPAVVKEAVFADKTSDGDLRIMDFDVSPTTEGACLVTMAMSNSTVKTYAYTTETGFRLVARGRYTGACVTKVELLRDEDGALEIVTAASDGHLSIWTCARPAPGDVAEYVPELVVRLHQSSIKAFCLRHDGREEYIVFTGGDDNALVVTALSRTMSDRAGRWTLVSKHGVRRAHAAAVNGMVILPGGAAGSTTLATVSNDQRLKVWEVLESDQGAQIRLLGDRNSAVADAGDVAVVSSGEGVTRVMVVGVGMEVWSFQHGKQQSLRIATEDR